MNHVRPAGRMRHLLAAAALQLASLSKMHVLEISAEHRAASMRQAELMRQRLMDMGAPLLRWAPCALIQMAIGADKTSASSGRMPRSGLR